MENGESKQKQSPGSVLLKKDVLKSFAKFTGKHLCRSLFFNKVVGIRKTPTQVLCCEFCEIFKKAFFKEHLWWLLFSKELVSINKVDSVKGTSKDKHYLKSVLIRSYSGPQFPVFGLNMERYGVSLRIQSKCEKMRTRITPNTDTFYTVKSPKNQANFMQARLLKTTQKHSL